MLTLSEIINLAMNGDKEAQYTLGKFYRNGEQLDKDIDKAIYWYTKAANQGDMDSRFHLGCIYSSESLPQYNLIKGAYWYQEAAMQGDADSQFF